MPMRRFAQAAIVRLPISGGDWLDVKAELTAGEQREMFTAMVRTTASGEPVFQDGRPLRDPTLFARSMIAAYVLDWSFVLEGRPIEVSVQTIDGLLPLTFAEVADAVNAHDDRVRAAQEAEKNAPDGASSSRPISPSVA